MTDNDDSAGRGEALLHSGETGWVDLPAGGPKEVPDCPEVLDQRGCAWWEANWGTPWAAMWGDGEFLLA